MSNNNINIGIIGLGYWGINYLRVFNELPMINQITACDTNIKILERINNVYPHINTYNDYNNILNSEDIDAIVVSTPATTHFDITKKALIANKHVLVEKPITTDLDEAVQLVNLSNHVNKRLMVGHVFEFNPAILEIKKRIEANELGNVYYLHFTRTGLGPIRDDVNAVWDLAPHDISILLYLFGNLPEHIYAHGKCFIKDNREDIAFITLEFPNNIIANIHISWLDPRKKREITVVGDKKMLVFDDVDPINKIIIYDRGILKEPIDGTLGEFQLSLRIGDIYMPKIEAREPLKDQCKYFIDKIVNKEKIVKADAMMGANVVKILAEIDKQMKAHE